MMREARIPQGACGTPNGTLLHHVVKAARSLTADEWQFAKVAKKQGIFKKAGKQDAGSTEWQTRVVKDACIFLNRTDFAAGPGCALHLHALNSGEHFSEFKIGRAHV